MRRTAGSGCPELRLDIRSDINRLGKGGGQIAIVAIHQDQRDIVRPGCTKIMEQETGILRAYRRAPVPEVPDKRSVPKRLGSGSLREIDEIKAHGKTIPNLGIFEIQRGPVLSRGNTQVHRIHYITGTGINSYKPYQ